VTSVSSESLPDPNIDPESIDLREYIGISSRDNEFHLAWTDLRNWNGGREEGWEFATEGDIFTARIEVTGDVVSMGDGDADCDVDNDDWSDLVACMTTYDPEDCELFDFNLDGRIYKDDLCALYDCATGYISEYPSFCRESASSSGSHSTESCQAPHIESCIEVFTEPQRVMYAQALLEMASAPSEPDAGAMIIIANGILEE
jgi:hypothetical protein